MIVEKITSQKRKKDDRQYWRVEFSDAEYPLLMYSKPQFSEGDNIPEDTLKLAGKEGQEYYTLKEKPKQSNRTYGKSQEEIASIELQVEKKLAVELYCHVTEQGSPFDGDLLLKLFRACQALGKDLITVAKQQYGAVEK